jgi:hypothetical protein
LRECTLKEIGNFKYPNLGGFKDALEIAQEAIDKYAGVIPNHRAAEKLGYKIKDPTKISGPIYKRLADLATFGFFEKIKGGYRTTALAEKALDPYDSAKATEGKAEAIRTIPIIERAFTEWSGEIPSETAFPAKLQRLIEGISWKEAQNHTESLRKLFNEVFPYLKATPEPTTDPDKSRGVGGESMEPEYGTGKMTINAKGKGFGFTKTLPFTSKGIQSLKVLIEFLETQVEEEKTEEQQND